METIEQIRASVLEFYPDAKVKEQYYELGFYKAITLFLNDFRMKISHEGQLYEQRIMDTTNEVRVAATGWKTYAEDGLPQKLVLDEDGEYYKIKKEQLLIMPYPEGTTQFILYALKNRVSVMIQHPKEKTIKKDDVDFLPFE